MCSLEDVEAALAQCGIRRTGISIGEIKENEISVLYENDGILVFHFERGSRFWERSFGSARGAAEYICELSGWPAKVLMPDSNRQA